MNKIILRIYKKTIKIIQEMKDLIIQTMIQKNKHLLFNHKIMINVLTSLPFRVISQEVKEDTIVTS